MSYSLHNGDALEVLKTLEDESIDSLVSDPPAGISFMGKSWDRADIFQVQMRAIFEEILRVLKPGAHGLVWALPRTSHWTATALEEAGFEIRDVITHVFGSGFPKSHNIGNSIDKLQGCPNRGRAIPAASTHFPTGRYKEEKLTSNKVEPFEAQTEEGKQWQGWGTALKPASEHWILVRKPIRGKSIAENVLEYGTGGINIDGCRIGTDEHTIGGGNQDNMFHGGFDPNGEYVPKTVSGRFPANFILSHDPDCEVKPDDKRYKHGLSKHPLYALWGNIKQRCENPRAIDFDDYGGRGLQLHKEWSEDATTFIEDVIQEIGEKPGKEYSLDRIDNEVGYEPGNIRWATPKEQANNRRLPKRKIHPELPKGVHKMKDKFQAQVYENRKTISLGTFETPEEAAEKVQVYETNRCHSDCPVQELDKQSGICAPGGWGHVKTTGFGKFGGGKSEPTGERINGTAGGVSRFFYCAKPSKAERNEGLEDFPEQNWVEFGTSGSTKSGVDGNPSKWSEGRDTKRRNVHPTVKPIKLMRYLCRLITPKGGTVLDPFLGSGTTGIAAIQEDFDFIGIEREKEYYEIAEARISNADYQHKTRQNRLFE